MSIDGKMKIPISVIFEVFSELGLKSIQYDEVHGNSFRKLIPPLVFDHIISFSSKSLVIGLNKLQCCKIRLDGKCHSEIENIKKLDSSLDLFPDYYGEFSFANGWKGIIMERITVFDKLNFTARELHNYYWDFCNKLERMHSLGIVHNDLGKITGTNYRPNIVLSKNGIKLLDFESLKLNGRDPDFDLCLKKEIENVTDYYNEVVNYYCYTLT